MFVAAYHEFREAVADPNYHVTTARERLASTKGVNLDSQFVKKIRDLIADIDGELYNSVYTFSADSTKYGKIILMSHTRKLHMLQTMSYVEYKAFGEGERNESAPERECFKFVLQHRTEGEMDVKGSIICQAKGQAETTGEPQGENTKPASDEVVNGKGMSKEHNTLVEGATADEGKGKQIESVLNEVANGKGMSKEHNTLVEGATTDEGKGKQTEPTLNDMEKEKSTKEVHSLLHNMLPGINNGKEKQKKRKRKGKSKKNEMPSEDGINDEGKSKENDDFLEASTLDNDKGEESELLIKGSATDKGKNEEFGLPPAEDELQGAKSNDDDDKVSNECHALIQEAKDIDVGPISDDEDDEVGRNFAMAHSDAQDAGYDYEIDNKAEQDALIAFRNIHRLMRHAIRHQTATPDQLDLYCRFVGIDALFFNVLSQITEELKWNR